MLAGTSQLAIDDVAEIAGAFNAAQLFRGSRIDQAGAGDVFAAWWEGTVNQSGLEIASPALDQMKAPYELLDPPGRGTVLAPELNYRYPDSPANGKRGWPVRHGPGVRRRCLVAQCPLDGPGHLVRRRRRYARRRRDDLVPQR